MGGMHMGPNHEFFKRPPGSRYDPMFPDVKEPGAKLKSKYKWLE